MGNRASLVLLVLSLAGCGGNDMKMKADIGRLNAEVSRTQVEASKLPIVDITIPQVCEPPRVCPPILVIVRDRQSPVKHAAVPEHPGWRVADRFMGILGIGVGALGTKWIINESGDATAAAVEASASNAKEPLVVNPVIVPQPMAN